MMVMMQEGAGRKEGVMGDSTDEDGDKGGRDGCVKKVR